MSNWKKLRLVIFVYLLRSITRLVPKEAVGINRWISQIPREMEEE